MRCLLTVLILGLLAAGASPQSQTSEKGGRKTSMPVAAKKISEQAEWDKTNAVTETVKRIQALRKFIEVFPGSARKAQAFENIAAGEAELGNQKLAAGDRQAASVFFKAAAEDAPKPPSDKLFTETLSKIPANLFFRGLRNEALEIAKILEDKSDTNAGQLLSIAAFYLSVENGAEAKRVSENVIKINPNSAAAYQTLGLANRIDFKLKESAAGYEKALELDPDSIAARRGLAETKRSLGLPNEAVALYREILAKEESNLPARTGLILALFDADKRTEAEAEMAKSLEANPGNVILLAGAAYWYAAHNDGPRAVALARKAIESDPRFIWSHIALARGLLIQNRPVDAERTLLAARRYGNFPTLEYEIASARLAAGLYREAAEELSKSFSVKEGVIHANMGGRVPLGSEDFTELVGFERRASIFAPMAADDPDNAAKLKALLEFRQELSASAPNLENLASAADALVKGTDNMKVHRQLFVASELLEKKVAIPKVLEIVKTAPASLDAGLEVANPATAVLASELYESRTIAAAGNQYVSVPEVPRQTLLSILRGRVEEINGWARYQLDDTEQAVVHLKRAVSVLPVDSAWWRSSMWRLGTTLVVSGKDAEGLEAYIKSYKSSGPNAIRYKTIEAVYKRVNGNTSGLEEKIGPDPSPTLPADAVAQNTGPPTSKAETPAQVPEKTETITPTSDLTPESAPVPSKTETPPAETIAQKNEPTPQAKPEAQPAVETKVELPSDSVANEASKPDPTPEVSTPSEAERSTSTQKIPEEKTKDNSWEEKRAATSKELFPPVIITIPTPEPRKSTRSETTPSPTPAEIKPCTLITNEEKVTLESGGNLAITVRMDGDGELEGLTAVTSSPEDIAVRREAIEGIKTQALFVVRSLTSIKGEYQVRFEMPCGKKEVAVRVQ